MSSSLAVDPAVSPPPENLVELGAYGTLAEGADRGLVILAMGGAYWLMPGDAGFRLLVEPHVADSAREQLRRFDCESLRWPPRPLVDPAARKPLEVVLPMLGSALILVLYIMQTTRPAWTERGALDATALFVQGEWWRPFTALFLHGSGDHAIANALSGLLVSCAVLTTFGRMRGALFALGSAVAANVAIAALHYPEPYRSLGASTAIFAGVGLLMGRTVRFVARSTHPHRWRMLFVPLMAGLTVLALYGAGGIDARTDVGAHVMGFVVGALAGYSSQMPSKR